MRKTRQKLEDRVEEMKTRMGEVMLKAADLRKVNNDLKDSISKSDEIIANLKIELSMAKHRAQVMEQRASEGEARDRNVLIEQAGILSRKLEEEAAARVSLEYSVTRLQSSTNALKEEHRARVDELNAADRAANDWSLGIWPWCAARNDMASCRALAFCTAALLLGASDSWLLLLTCLPEPTEEAWDWLSSKSVS